MAAYPYMQNQYAVPYGQYNTLAPYQQRLDQMQQQYQQPMQNQPFQNQQPQQQPPMNIKGWPVASEDDARKAMIELDGTVFLFPDVQNGRVYSKQINTADFSPIFRTYQLVDTQERQEVSAPDMTGFVSRQDFDQTVQSLKEEIERLSAVSAVSASAPKKGVKETDQK